jgi:hypothetical protein
MATKAPLHRPTIDDVIGPTTPANPPPAKPVFYELPPTRMVSAKLPYSLYSAINELRHRTGITMTDLIVEVLTPEVARRLAKLNEGGPPE